MTFAEKSKLLRKERNLSQIELGKALNVSKACISMIEIGKNEPTSNTLIKYADFFECSIDYLLDREDDFGNITIKKEKSSTDNFSAEEIKLIEDYRSLQPALKEMIQATIQTWKKSSINNKNNKKHNNFA